MIAFLAAALALQVTKPPVLPKDPSTLVRVADHAKQPSIAFDADGNVFIAFYRSGNVEVAVSNDGGQSFAAPVTALDAKGLTLAYGKFSDQGKRLGKTVLLASNCCEKCPPAITVDPRGYPSIAYREGPKEKANRQIFLVSSNDGGKTFGTPVQLNSV